MKAHQELPQAERNRIESEIWYQELTALGELWTKPIQEESLSKELEELEKRRIADAMDVAEGNRSRAAKYLGIGRTLLLHKLKKYEMQY